MLFPEKMNRKQSTENKVPSTALAAVAYQDHLLKDLAIDNLSLVDPFKALKPSVTHSLKQQETKRKAAIKNARSTIDTGRKKKNIPVARNKSNNEVEYVLDPKPSPLTLAQKLGLIPRNSDQEELLSENDWKELKHKSIIRQDFKGPCVICKDDFRIEDQVLLSCSHVFHRACLQAFERFTGRKSCPMCRRQHYQTRVVHEGTKYYKHKSATKIQSAWRGYVVRKWYEDIRRANPPKNPALRKKFFEKKLTEITDRFVAETTGDTVDRFLHDIDQSVQNSRDVFRHFENSQLMALTSEQWMEIKVRATERGATDCPICLRGLSNLNKTIANGKIGTSKNEPIALLSCSHVFHATCLNALESFSMDSEVIAFHSSNQAHHTHSNTTQVSSNDLSLGDDLNPEQNISNPLLNSPVSFKCPVCRSLYRKRIVNI